MLNVRNIFRVRPERWVADISHSAALNVRVAISAFYGYPLELRRRPLATWHPPFTCDVGYDLALDIYT